MTEYANPSNDFRPLSEPMSRCFRFAGHSEGFVVENTVIVSDVDSVGLTAGPLEGFDKTGESNLDVEIGTGEGVIEGTVVGKDTRTTVSLPANSTSTVVLAYDPGTESNVIIDTDSNVTASAGDIPRNDLFSFTTDGDSITAQEDLRVIGERVDVRNDRYESTDGTGTVAVDNSERLDNVDSTSYARLDQNEIVTGTWTFNNNVTVDADLDVTGTTTSDIIEVDEGGDGLRIAVSGDRLFMAPIQEGDARFGSEITYIANDDKWNVESQAFEAPNASPATKNDDILTGDDVRRIGSVTIPLTPINDGGQKDAFVSTSDNDNVKIVRVSMTDAGGTEPPSGVEVQISGEGGGQRLDLATRLTVGSLTNPVHTVGGTGSVRFRLFNSSGSQEELSAHAVYYVA